MILSIFSAIKIALRHLYAFYKINQVGIFVIIGTTLPYLYMFITGNREQIFNDFQSIDKAPFLLFPFIILIANTGYKFLPPEFQNLSLSKVLNTLSTLLIAGLSLFIINGFLLFSDIFKAFKIAISYLGSSAYGFYNPFIGIFKCFFYIPQILFLIFIAILMCSSIIWLSDYSPKENLFKDIKSQLIFIRSKYTSLVRK